MGLYVEKTGQFFYSRKDLQLARVQGRISWAESEVVIDLLKAVEAGVEDGDWALNDGAVLKAVDVAGVKSVGKIASLGAGTVTRNTFAIFRLEKMRFFYALRSF